MLKLPTHSGFHDLFLNQSMSYGSGLLCYAAPAQACFVFILIAHLFLIM